MGLRNADGNIEIEVLFGAPGAGKSIAMRDEALAVPGLYLFCLPTLFLIQEQADEFRKLKPGLTVIEARSGEGGGRGKVQRQLDDARTALEAAGTNHAVLFTTHESMMSCDLSGFVDWHIRIDEVPNAIQTGKVNIGTSESRRFFRDSFTLDPAGEWAHAKLTNPQGNWKDRAGDALLGRLSEFFKLAARPQGAHVNVLTWKDVKTFEWISLWSPTFLEHAASLKIAAAAYLDSLGYKAAKKWWGDEIEIIETEIPRDRKPRSGWPTIRIHYFTRGHEGTSKFWGESDGRRMIKAVCDHLVDNVPDIGFWSGNEDVRALMEWRVGKPDAITVPKVAGSNKYRSRKSCAYIYSSKPLPGDAPLMGSLFKMSKDDVLAAREDEDIHQFVMRGIIRQEDYDDDYDIYVYSERQANALKVKLERIARSVEVIPIDEADIMDETFEKAKKADQPEKVVVRVAGAKGKGARLLKSKKRQEQRMKARLNGHPSRSD